MWDYDKLFANNNVVGVKVLSSNNIYNYVVDSRKSSNIIWSYYKNSKLKDTDDGNSEIQYIIRLDEHGNVIERLFDREVDMPKPMPELEDGMFGKIGTFDWDEYGNVEYLNIEDFVITNNRVLFVQHDGEIGSWGLIEDLVDSTPNNKYALCDEDISTPIEIYKNVKYLIDDSDTFEVIWRHPEYQKYLDSKSK